MNMFCSKCGNQVGEDAAFCSKCGAKIIVNAEVQETKLFSNTCDSCGAKLKRVADNHYICEYCGSEYHTNDQNEVASRKLTEKELLDVFYKAAEFDGKEKYWEELQCLLAVEETASDNVLYMVKLGRAYRRNTMYAKALECYEKAQKLNPEYASIYSNIGAVYIATKQYEKALAPCQKAVGLMNKYRAENTDSDYAVAHSNLALAYGYLGQKDRAKEFLRIAEANGYKNGNAIRKMVGIRKGLFS